MKTPNRIGLAIGLVSLIASGCAHSPLPATAANPTADPKAATPAASQETSQAKPENASDKPAGVRGELSSFQGTYSLTEGKQSKCSETLQIGVEYADNHAVSRVHLTEAKDEGVELAIDAGPQEAPAEGKCSRFTEDQLTDNNDKALAMGRAVAETGPRWEIKRSYSRKCRAKGATTFAGFQVWQFTPHGTSGSPEIGFHSILGPEFRCAYKKN